MAGFVQKVLEDLIGHRVSLPEAVDKISAEMGRGGRILVIDENLLDLEAELAAKNYTVEAVEISSTDTQIMKQLRSRILITRNGRDFAEPKLMKEYYYGLVWVRSRLSAPDLANTIEEKLMASGFARNLVQVVRV